MCVGHSFRHLSGTVLARTTLTLLSQSFTIIGIVPID
jgi:hypothetical protein